MQAGPPASSVSHPPAQLYNNPSHGSPALLQSRPGRNPNIHQVFDAAAFSFYLPFRKESGNTTVHVWSTNHTGVNQE